MKQLNIIVSLIITTILAGTYNPLEAQVKITDGAVLNMDANSLLELESTNKGLLIPRMAINSLSLVAPLTGTVPVGMMVYSSGGAIPDGFYYWDGSSWVRLVVSTDPEKNFNFVTKSANTTLLKTENLVFASGDITLTLPTITGEDDGVEITIKNIGTYADLIIVLTEAGKSIDGSVSEFLTRWQGRTFVAMGSNWILKEKITSRDNYYEVSASGSFTTIAEVVAFLNSHINGPSVVKLGGGAFTISATQTINFPYPVTFEGLSFGETSIDADAGVSGSPLFICETECHFKFFIFNAFANTAGNDAIRFTGSVKYHEVKDCTFSGFNKGIVSADNNDLWVFETDFENCAGAGVEIAAGAASGGSFKISECDFMQCAIGISLLSGISETVSIINCTFYNTPSGTDIALLYTPATFTPFSTMIITNNGWNNQGTYISGFDFTRSDGRDADAFMENNPGMEDKNPHCKINVVNNTATTNVTTAGTYYKANWVNTTIYTCKWTITNNRITYQPNNTGDGYAMISGDLSVGNTNRVITIAIVKNGVTTLRFGETALRITTASQPFQFSSVIYVPDLTKNDYLELYITSGNNGDIVTFQDVQWFTNTQ